MRLLQYNRIASTGKEELGNGPAEWHQVFAVEC